MVKRTARLVSDRSTQIDGPYGWCVVAASFLAHVFILGFSYSSGVYYEAFMELFDEGSGKVSLIATLSTACAYGLGPVTGLLINRFGHRPVTIAGGLIAGTGLVLSAFATNIYYMGATFAVITGLGYGLAYLSSVSIVPLYFNKWQSVALGVAVSGVGIGMFIYPPLTRILIDNFGVRGSLLIMGGIIFNICVCGAVMRPVERMDVDTDYPRKQDHMPNGQLSKSSSACPNFKTKRKILFDALHMEIFRNFGYVVLCVNNFLCLVGITVVFVHVAAFTEERGVSRSASVMVISAIGISNFIGRPLSGLLARLPWPCCTALMLYSSSLIICGIVIMFLPLASSFWTIVICACCFGILSATNATMTPKLIVEYLNLSLIPIGYGYLLVFNALGCLVGPPLAGYLYDSLHTYDVSFFFAGSVITSAGLVMLLPRIIQQISLKKNLVDDEIDVDVKETL